MSSSSSNQFSVNEPDVRLRRLEEREQNFINAVRAGTDNIMEGFNKIERELCDLRENEILVPRSLFVYILAQSILVFFFPSKWSAFIFGASSFFILCFSVFVFRHYNNCYKILHTIEMQLINIESILSDLLQKQYSRSWGKREFLRIRTTLRKQNYFLGENIKMNTIGYSVIFYSLLIIFTVRVITLRKDHVFHMLTALTFLIFFVLITMRVKKLEAIIKFSKINVDRLIIAARPVEDS